MLQLLLLLLPLLLCCCAALLSATAIEIWHHCLRSTVSTAFSLVFVPLAMSMPPVTSFASISVEGALSPQPNTPDGLPPGERCRHFGAALERVHQDLLALAAPGSVRVTRGFS